MTRHMQGELRVTASSSMNSVDIGTIAVIGSGFMGHGIALDFAARGYDVRMYGRSAARLQQAVQAIEHELPLLKDSGQVSEAQLDAALSHVQTGSDLGEIVSGVDLAVEAL